MRVGSLITGIISLGVGFGVTKMAKGKTSTALFVGLGSGVLGYTVFEFLVVPVIEKNIKDSSITYKRDNVHTDDFVISLGDKDYPFSLGDAEKKVSTKYGDLILTTVNNGKSINVRVVKDGKDVVNKQIP